MQIIAAKVHSLSTHTLGCRLVQRVLEHCSIAEIREQVVAGGCGVVLIGGASAASFYG